MKTKDNTKLEPDKARNGLGRFRDAVASMSVEKKMAMVATMPHVRAAGTIKVFQDTGQMMALADELSDQVAEITGGNLEPVEAMLICQAQTLDSLFNNLAWRAHCNIKEHLHAAEAFMRLALKAQGQCRATLETLAAIKNPPVIYARQANIANGPQQINNGVPTHAREIEKQQSKLSGIGHELSSNSGTSALAGGVNQAVEAVEAIDRAEVKGG